MEVFIYQDLRAFFNPRLNSSEVIKANHFLQVCFVWQKISYIPFQPITKQSLVGENFWENFIPIFFVVQNSAQPLLAFQFTNHLFYLKYFSCVMYSAFGTYYLNTHIYILRAHLNYHLKTRWAVHWTSPQSLLYISISWEYFVILLKILSAFL